MKTFRIVHREELVGYFYVEAETPEEALKEWYHQVNNGEIDFSDMEMDDSSEEAIEMSEDETY
jgi:hypothetical protein